MWDLSQTGGAHPALYDGGNNGIEDSPAAHLLCDYFKKGGIGGISALDLGFKNEPALWSDWFLNYNPIVHDDEDLKFYLPKEKFCVGCECCDGRNSSPRKMKADRTRADLMPWKIPKLPTLSEYGKQAAQKFLPSVPLVHRGTLQLSTMSTHTAFALTVAGAAYSPDGEQFSNDMLVEKRVYLVRSEF